MLKVRILGDFFKNSSGILAEFFKNSQGGEIDNYRNKWSKLAPTIVYYLPRQKYVLNEFDTNFMKLSAK